MPLLLLSLFSPEVVAASFPRPSLLMRLLQKAPERAEIEVEVLVAKTERLLQLVHPLAQPHEGQSEPLDLLVAERPGVHAPQRLALHQLAEQLDQRQHELREPLLHLLRVRGHAPRRPVGSRIQAAGDRLDIAARDEQAVERLVPLGHAGSSTKLNGGQGPVKTTVSPSWASANACTTRRASSSRRRGTRYAAPSSSPGAAVPPRKDTARARLETSRSRESTAARRCDSSAARAPR